MKSKFKSILNHICAIPGVKLNRHVCHLLWTENNRNMDYKQSLALHCDLNSCHYGVDLLLV